MSWVVNVASSSAVHFFERHACSTNMRKWSAWKMAASWDSQDTSLEMGPVEILNRLAACSVCKRFVSSDMSSNDRCQAPKGSSRLLVFCMRAWTGFRTLAGCSIASAEGWVRNVFECSKSRMTSTSLPPLSSQMPLNRMVLWLCLEVLELPT